MGGKSWWWWGAYLIVIQPPRIHVLTFLQVASLVSHGLYRSHSVFKGAGPLSLYFPSIWILPMVEFTHLTLGVRKEKSRQTHLRMPWGPEELAVVFRLENKAGKSPPPPPHRNLSCPRLHLGMSGKCSVLVLLNGLWIQVCSLGKAVGGMSVWEHDNTCMNTSEGTTYL